MAELTITLLQSVEQAGGDLSCTLRELTLGDTVAANQAAETLYNSDSGPVLVVSQAKAEMEMRRRHIAKLGPLNGPIALSVLAKLSSQDAALIDAAIGKLTAPANRALIEGLKQLESGQPGREEEPPQEPGREPGGGSDAGAQRSPGLEPGGGGGPDTEAGSGLSPDTPPNPAR